MTRLGDICRFQSGGTPPKNDPENYGGNIPWITTVALNGKVINGDNAIEWITEKAIRESATKIVPAYSIMVGTRVGVGKVAINGIPMATSQDIISLIDIDETKWDKEYLCKLILANSDYLNAQARGATIKGIKIDVLAGIEVPSISVEEQRKVSAVIERTDSMISLRKKQLQKLDDLVKSRFVEMFGDLELNPMEWPVEALGDVLSVEPQNGLYKPQSDYAQDGTGIPILRIDAFYDGRVTDFSRLKRLKCTDTERSRYLLMENDIVINRVNSLEYLGKCAWITGLIEPTVFESNMMRFHVDESRIDPCYMTRLLCSTFIYKQILNRAKKAVNQASINQGDVQSFKILVPPVGLQKKYADFVAQVDKSKAVVQKALDEAQLLFDSLMQKYFG